MMGRGQELRELKEANLGYKVDGNQIGKKGIMWFRDYARKILLPLTAELLESI